MADGKEEAGGGTRTVGWNRCSGQKAQRRVSGAAGVGGARQAEALYAFWNQPTGGRHVGC